MANILTLNNPTPATVPADGWKVGYKILGSGGPYTTVGPFMAMPINISTADPVGTLYEGYITRDCGSLESVQYFWQTPCDCSNAGVGYETSPSGNQCELIETTAPTITNSEYCLATSQNGAYTNYCSRIYNPIFVDADISIDPFTIVPLGGGTDPAIFQQLTTTGQWANPGNLITIGPLNREGVWVDSDCDGDIDTATLTATISCNYNNVTGSNKTIYVGVGGDNGFILNVNGTEVADSGTSGDLQFKIWHIFPITVVPGINYINVVSTNAGGAQSVGLVLYDNTASEIAAATSDLDLNIPFASHILRGTSFDVATCPSGYSLDTSGGVGNYICVRTTYADCNLAPAP